MRFDDLAREGETEAEPPGAALEAAVGLGEGYGSPIGRSVLKIWRPEASKSEMNTPPWRSAITRVHSA